MLTHYEIQVDLSRDTPDNPWHTIATFTDEGEAEEAMKVVQGHDTNGFRIQPLKVFETTLEYQAFIYQTGIDADLVPNPRAHLS